MSLGKILSIIGVAVALSIAAVGYHYSQSSPLPIKAEDSGSLLNNKTEIKPESTNKLRAWTQATKDEVIKGHKKAFIHFTGDGCIDCHFQWAAVNIERLKASALESGILLYEANMVPGSPDNDFIMRDLISYGLGGVPAYVFYDSNGKHWELKARLRKAWDVKPTDKGTDRLIQVFKRLK